MVISLPFTMGTVELENLRPKSFNTDTRVVLTICIIQDTVYHCTASNRKLIFTENKRKIKFPAHCQIHTHLTATLTIPALLPVLYKTRSWMFLSEVIFTCPITTEEKCNCLSCVDLWGKILALSILAELQWLACLGQSSQSLLGTLSPPICSWREKFGGLLERQHKLTYPKKVILIFSVLILKLIVWFLLGLLLSRSIALFPYCSGN